jgi:hypothetical protein
MLYMFLAVSSPATRTSGMSGPSGGPATATMALSHPTLAFVFAFILVGYGIWDLDQLSGRRSAARARVSLAVIGPVGLLGLDAGRAVETANESAAAAPPAAASRSGGAAGAGGPHPGSGAAFLLSPAVTVGCRITMSIVMAFMLLIAL